MCSPIIINICLSAISNNISIIRSYAPKSKMWAIIKSNAYGHGIKNIFSALNQVDGCGVINIEEAIRLRELGWVKPILLLEGFFQISDLYIISQYNIVTVVHSNEQLRMMEIAKISKPINIYLKMNSGMNRLGYKPNNFYTAWKRASSCINISNITIMSHFYNSENKIDVMKQMKMINYGSKNIKTNRSLANSAAILLYPFTHFNWIRPGIILYGASPGIKNLDITKLGLIPVMTYSSKIIAVQNIKKGETIGYGNNFIAKQNMRIGIVACGYADGYPRSARKGTPIIVGDVKTRVVGQVAMNMLTVDISKCPKANVGTYVEAWGKKLLIDDVAQYCGTVGYNLMCGIISHNFKKIEIK